MGLHRKTTSSSLRPGTLPGAKLYRAIKKSRKHKGNRRHTARHGHFSVQWLYNRLKKLMPSASITYLKLQVSLLKRKISNFLSPHLFMPKPSSCRGIYYACGQNTAKFPELISLKPEEFKQNAKQFSGYITRGEGMHFVYAGWKAVLPRLPHFQ